MYSSVSKLKVVAGSWLKVSGSSMVRRHVGSLSVDELADLREFQLENEDHTPWSELSEQLSNIQTAEVQPFEKIPGPRGLPFIGNMLSYSKFGTSGGDFALTLKLQQVFCLSCSRCTFLFFLFVIVFIRRRIHEIRTTAIDDLVAWASASLFIMWAVRKRLHDRCFVWAGDRLLGPRNIVLDGGPYPAT